MNNSSEIKTIYSDDVKEILDEIKIEDLLRACVELRKQSELKNCSNKSVIVQALMMYKRKRERIIKNKERLKNG